MKQPAEVKIGEITNAYEVERDGEKRIVVEAKAEGDVDLFLRELREHGLTIFLNIEAQP